MIDYKITFNDNLSIVKEEKWKDKNAFIEEFYNDLYDWFKENATKLEYVTIDGNKITINKNGKIAEFSNALDLKAVDKYVFEVTVSNYMAKEVVRNNDGTCVFEETDAFFLNSKKYRVKYQGMDQYLLACIKANYSSYNTTYKPTSAGKIQIFFRFQQWQQGTSIAPFENIPSKYVETKDNRVTVEMPNDMTYTIESEVTLPTLNANVEFLGWYLDKECTKPITKIEKRTTGNIVLYAKWNLE